MTGLKVVFLFLTLTLLSKGTAFGGFETAAVSAKELFLSGNNGGDIHNDQVKDYKQRLIQFSNSPAFQNLSDGQKNQIHSLVQHSRTYLNISNYLDECEKRLKHPDKRNLIGQIRKSLAHPPLCDDSALGLLSFAERQSIEDILTPAEETAFMEDLKFNSIKNAGLSILKYNLQLGLSDRLDSSQLDKLANELCGRWCGRERKKQLKEFLSAQEKQIREGIENGSLTKYTSSKGAEELNKRIANLETTLDEIDFEMRTFTESEESINPIYDLYFEQYKSSAGDIAGVLMLTDIIRKESGSLINLNDIKNQVFKEKKLQNGTTIYEGSRPRHRPLSDSYSCPGRKGGQPKIVTAKEAAGLDNCTLFQSAEDKFTLAVREAVKRAKKFSKKIRKRNNLKKLIKKSPVAAGQSLIKYPGAAEKVCDTIIHLSNTGKKNEQISNYADKTIEHLKDGAIGLAAEGIESRRHPTAKYAGQAVKTAGSYFLSASVLGGVGLGVVKAAVGAGRSAVFTRQKQEMINSRIASATTKSDIERIRAIESDLALSKARLMDAGMGMAPFGALNKLRKVRGWARMRGQKPTLSNQLFSEENLINLHKELLEPQNSEARNKLSEFSKTSKNHAEQAGILMIGLSQMEPELKNQVLNRLNNMESIATQPIEELVDDLEEIMSQCTV